MLPNFLIIGTQKGATTWLANSIGKHPDVFMIAQKELHFFDEHFKKGITWYEPHFEKWDTQTAGGEATPGYLYFPDVPARIQTTLGNKVKLIVSLRHPVDRAYSAFWMFFRHGKLSLDDGFPTLFYQDVFGLRTRGYYFDQLKRYLDYFPRENMLILIYETLKENNQQTMARCFDFLGVNSQFVPDKLETKAYQTRKISKYHDQIWGVRRTMAKLPRDIERPLVSFGRHIFKWIPNQRGYIPLAETVRQELLKTYTTDIKQLETLLGQDLSIWYK